MMREHYQRMEPQVGRLGHDARLLALHGGDDHLSGFLAHLLQDAIVTASQQLGHVAAARITATTGFDDLGEPGQNVGTARGGGAARLG